MDGVKVTYRGPSAAYSAEYDGQWYEFVSGEPLTVPQAFANRLRDVRDHTFEVAKASQSKVSGSVPVTGSTQGSRSLEPEA